MTYPDRALHDEEGNVVYGDEAPPQESKPPVNPKVVAGAVWGFVAPVLLAVVLAVIGWLGTDDGRALTAGWPVVAQVAFFAAVAAVSSGLAGYRTSDRHYREQRTALGV